MNRSSVAVAVMLVVAGAVFAGEPDEETRGKLQMRISIEAGAASLEELLRMTSEQTGLSMVVSSAALEKTEPVEMVIRDVPAGEFLEVLAWSMHLQMTVSPGGIIAFRLKEDDPRRMEPFEDFDEQEWEDEEEVWGEDEGKWRNDDEGDAMGIHEWNRRVREIMKRTMADPKVRSVLDEFDAKLFPARENEPEREILQFRIARGPGGESFGTVRVTIEGKIVEIDTFRPGGLRREGEQMREKREERF